jgi:hypothetical protein
MKKGVLQLLFRKSMLPHPKLINLSCLCLLMNRFRSQQHGSMFCEYIESLVTVPK